MQFIFPKRPLGQTKINNFSNLVYPNIGSVFNIRIVAGSINVSTCGLSTLLGETNLQSLDIGTCGLSIELGETNLQSLDVSTCALLTMLGETNLQSLDVSTCGFLIILGET